MFNNIFRRKRHAVLAVAKSISGPTARNLARVSELDVGFRVTDHQHSCFGDLRKVRNDTIGQQRRIGFDWNSRLIAKNEIDEGREFKSVERSTNGLDAFVADHD